MIFISNDHWMDCPIVHHDFHQVLAAENLSILGPKMSLFWIPDTILGVFQLFWGSRGVLILKLRYARNACCFTGENRLMDGSLSG